MKVVSALLVICVLCMYERVDFALSQALQTNIEYDPIKKESHAFLHIEVFCFSSLCRLWSHHKISYEYQFRTTLMQ